MPIAAHNKRNSHHLDGILSRLVEPFVPRRSGIHASLRSAFHLYSVLGFSAQIKEMLIAVGLALR
jgi:hypothetical protein